MLNAILLRSVVFAYFVILEHATQYTQRTYLLQFSTAQCTATYTMALD